MKNQYVKSNLLHLLLALTAILTLLGCSAGSSGNESSRPFASPSSNESFQGPSESDASLDATIAPNGAIAMNSRSPTVITASNSAISVPGTAGALRASSLYPRELLTVNSVLVARPVISTTDGVRPELAISLYRILEDAARAQLSMKVEFEEDNSQLKSSKGAKKNNTNVDAVLRTKVTRYIDRIGSRIGGDQLASVKFAMELESINGEKDFWQGNYSFRDQPLTENLLRADQVFDDGIHWHTAPGLFRQGVEQALRELSETRERQFLSAKTVN